jgi:hypothetical protein
MTAKQPELSLDPALSETHSGHTPRFYQVRLSDRDAWFGASVAAIFNGLGMLIEIAIIRGIPGISTRPAEISAGFATIHLIILFINRHRPSVKWAYVSYLLTTVSVVIPPLFTDLRFAVSERNWVPFQEIKLGCLAAAMVAPGFWVGLVSILVYSLSALVQFQFFFPVGLKANAAAAEPWPTLAFALAGILALVYRFRRAQLEQEVARFQAQNAAIRRLARIFLSIRDRMNTPLQVIELSVDLLRKSDQPSEPILDRIDRSVDSLREINSVLIRHEKEIEWEAKL